MEVNIFKANKTAFQYVIIFLSILHFSALLSIYHEVIEFTFSSAGTALNITITTKEEIKNQSEFLVQ